MLLLIAVRGLLLILAGDNDLTAVSAVDVAMRTCAMVADGIVLALTWKRVWPMRNQTQALRGTSSFASVLFVDGTFPAASYVI